ncbi:hypothetical protein BC936DRAFT_146014 [Jimgerdemannia flammicorona]|uniref:Uncharacterized protein n=1 Tax=Jimgerdemannia flammicorona TaxID=994334 RepID=A0A433D8K4_9FUNG|nr:hypothetical protein BC936DRAFT_146014 [Jimgerdemannia flammicorona]
MSLVADYGSDSESSDTENSQQVRGPVATKPSSFASQLPPPKVDSGDSSPVKTDVARPVSTKTKRDGPVRIFVDLPKPSAAGDDSDSDAEEHKSKKPRLAPGFSGLAALLPAPKNERTMSSSKGSLGGGASKPVGGGFVPYSLTKKKDNMVTDGKGKGVAIAKADETKVEMAGEERKAIDEFEDEGEEEELNSSTVKSFFPLGPSITAAPPIDLPADEPEILPSAHPIQPSEPAAYVPTAADAYSYDPNAAYTYDANNTTCYYDADAYPVESGAAAQQQGGGNAGIDDSVVSVELDYVDKEGARLN